MWSEQIPGWSVMYTLSFPVLLPPGRTYFDDPTAVVPSLQDGLVLSCSKHSEGFPLLLTISGLETEQDAIDFAYKLRFALQWASLRRGHSFSPSPRDAAVSNNNHFEGSAPTIFRTALAAKPYRARASMVTGTHLALLSSDISEALTDGVPAKLASHGALSLALELFSDLEFVGGANARFVMLITILEVLLPNKTSSKRGAVVNLVKETLAKVGRTDTKVIGRKVHYLYERRNDLLHEARAVEPHELDEMQTIARDTLIALISGHN